MKRIILVDDDPAILDVFMLLFKGPEYAIKVFPDPQDLLSLRAGLPDLIFLDRQLSGADGLEICRRLKKVSMTRDIPVIMISASPDILQLAKDAGADAAVEKPFGIWEIRQLVQTTLASDRS